MTISWPAFAQGTPTGAPTRPAPVVPTATAVAPATPAPAATAAADNAGDFTPFWVAAYTATNLWSGSGQDAQSLGAATLNSPLQVLQPQDGPRLHVSNPVTQSDSWVDATAVAPIPTPSDQQLADLTNPPPPPPFQAFWVMTDQPSIAWSTPDADATAWTRIPQWRYLQVLQPPDGNRALTLDPRTNGYGWVDLSNIGPVGPPPDDYFDSAPQDDETLALPARIIGTTDLYEQPKHENYFALDRVVTNTPVTVQGIVDEPDGKWYHLDSGDYVPAQNVRTPDLPQRTFSGRWIDATLTEPVIVTAYEGDRPVYAALAVKGTTTFQTPTGVFQILRRVANETMDSETLSPPIPHNSPNGYLLKDVLFTQYFTNDGASIHYNYWYANWGYAGSHGCLGMNLADATFFWNFASAGTTVYVHN